MIQPELRFNQKNGEQFSEYEQVSLGDLYTERNEKGNSSLPILTISIHSGVSDGEADEDELGKRVTRSEDKSLYKRVYEGDLAFNMMRAWQGAIGVVKSEGMISPAYIAAIPNGKIYPPYMNYMMRTEKMIHTIDRQSYGLTDFRKRLYWNSFVGIKCFIPCVEEQKKVACFFEELDSRIDNQKRIIAELRKQRTEIVHKIFAQEIRFKDDAGEYYTGNFARYGVQFDVYYDDHGTAQNHGHQTWDAYLADDNGSQEIEVTTTQTVNRYSVSLTNHNLDTVLRNRMTDDEKVRYSLYNRTFGHRDYLFDLNSLPTYGGNGYTIPPEALSDERFARMIEEAEKHLGTPYVWGGYAPGGFDCSGFVSWVINHCGNGWDYGRLTAEGIRQVCAYVSPEEAKPGDIIFFERTYDTVGASHVGIYVGDGMMIHCGKPVQYTTIHTDYWNNHFMQFGRLP